MLSNITIAKFSTFSSPQDCKLLSLLQLHVSRDRAIRVPIPLQMVSRLWRMLSTPKMFCAVRRPPLYPVFASLRRIIGLSISLSLKDVFRYLLYLGQPARQTYRIKFHRVYLGIVVGMT